MPDEDRETRPRRRGSPKWLSATGELRSLDADEPRPRIRHEPSPPAWKKLVDQIAKTAQGASPPGMPADWPPDRQVLYIIDVPASQESGLFVVRLACRDRKATGDWSKPKTRGITFPPIEQLPDAEDQQTISLLAGAEEFYPEYEPRFHIPARLQPLILKRIGQSDRAYVRDESGDDEMCSLKWDDGPPWQFWIEARADHTAQQYLLIGSLQRDEQRRPLSTIVLAPAGGVVLFSDTAALLDDQGASHWVAPLRQQSVVRVPMAQVDQFLGELLKLDRLPRLSLPDELHIETVNVAPRPQLRIHTPSASAGAQVEHLPAELSFDYGGLNVPTHEPRNMIFQSEPRRLIIRDRRAEAGVVDRLLASGARRGDGSSPESSAFQIHQKNFGRIVRELVQENWNVEADGRLYRRAGKMRLSVSSGIDWFELRGDVDFDGKTARLPDLLAAIRRGETTVRLDDGTFGMLPESWLKKYGLFANLGAAEQDFIRFSSTQLGLLDALLASQPETTCDAAFERARNALHDFDGIPPIDPPATFHGTLRPYQREGLGWFDFLERFGFGGCLADDMGLGKTIQVLALLDARRQSANPNGQSAMGNRQSAHAPSLIVVPKSLVFNWHQEAARFTPNLRLLDHTGIDRIRGTGHLADYDAIITTYGTLRRDVEFLKDVEFAYVILDEAQAIKNPASESAKALRLVRGRHRLTLSGTPVQNHLGDLWSLFEFLNPGMLGSAGVFTGANSTLRNPDPETRTLLSRALRPFILRRTKQQVAADLPEKLEQTIYCELDSEQRKLYDELRTYYRQSLFQQVDRFGLGKARMQILEALLRLRQAALHPGLIDESRTGESSAKLDMLLPQLDEIIDEGHKALVFSQFTSMLAIVRARLDELKIPYEYLDGKTRDREQRVMHFQGDPACKLFLVSLKAGGLGLNLTAADYVFLLDPWWNPAIEQQAIDRTHRIGQTQKVYACRLIAKDTVEEKVLALQQTKRDLADAIITADNSLIRSLGREDLELLLS